VGYAGALSLAQQVADLTAQGDVKLLNFAYLALDRRAPLLGSGSSAKVYQVGPYFTRTHMHANGGVNVCVCCAL
jgi:hypothetical protein